MSGDLVRLVFVVAALCVVATPPRAADRETRVLVLNGTDPYLPAFRVINSSMRETLAKDPTRRFQFFAETLDAHRFAFGKFEQDFLTLLVNKYQGVEIDVVVAATPSALDFANRHRDRLWPNAWVFFHGITAPALENVSLRDRTAGVIVRRNMGGTVDLARRLQPDARRLLVVSGVAELDKEVANEARKALATLPESLKVEYVLGLPQTELMELMAREPASSIVLYLTQFRDRDGRPYATRDVLSAISAVSPAPIYSISDTYLGYGVAAGIVESFHSRGIVIAERLLQLAAGAPIPVFSDVPDQCAADARALRRWSLDERNLPEGCEVRFREFSIWREYRWPILGTLAVVLFQAALIAWLLFEHQGRRVAEQELRRRLLEVIHLNRAATASGLSASVAHDLNQPLGAILSNAEAAELYLRTDPPNIQRVEHILANIRRDNERAAQIIRHFRGLVKKDDALELQEFDVNDVVRNALNILESEASKRGVALTANYAEGALPVRADLVQMQQVILNLAMNGMDAMQSCAPGAGKMWIQTALTDKSEAEVLVANSGTGIPADKLNQIFDTFYTTKRLGTGLGLSIARTIVETYGGKIWAENRPSGGAAFRFTLPLAKGLPAQ